MEGGQRGAGVVYGVPILPITTSVLSGCGSITRYAKGLLPMLYGRHVGDCLGRVTSIYKVRGGLDARATHRDCTADVYLTGNMDVRGITGVLNRTSADMAGRCTEMLSRGVLGSVRGMGDYLSRLTVWWE